MSQRRHRQRTIRLAMIAVSASMLAGCATGGVTSSFFVDPSRYDLYDCKQLAAERVSVDKKVVDLEKLMNKAETGAAGGFVSGLAYGPDYSAVRSQRDLLDQKMSMNNCPAEAPPVIAAPAPAKKKKRKAQ
ncbi:MAG: hypothetical protein AB1342_14515 [Pseudomonadota bacterium]